MRLSKNNPFRQFYNYSYGRGNNYYVNNFCDLFWGNVLAFVFNVELNGKNI